MKNDLTLAIFGKTALSTTGTLAEHISMLNKMNLINVGELAELAISKTSNIERCSPCNPGFDLINGIEIKHGQTRSVKYNTRIAYISIKNKTGPIYAVVTELLTNKLYYFIFPESYYQQYNGNAFQINFHLSGAPKRFRRSQAASQSPWDYEVSSFKELCTLAKQVIN